MSMKQVPSPPPSSEVVIPVPINDTSTAGLPRSLELIERFVLNEATLGGLNLTTTVQLSEGKITGDVPPQGFDPPLGSREKLEVSESRILEI